MTATQPRLKIGISACFLYPDPARTAFATKTLQYIEQSMAHWIMAGGAVPVMIPSPSDEAASGGVDVACYAEWLDGLVLHGGADVWPGSYGETPLEERWSGDRLRDAYEAALVKAFVAAGKPVAATVLGYKDVPVNSETALEAAIAQTPVSVAVEADQSVFQFYSGGVMDSACGTQLDHGVLAVGYGTLGGKDYYLVKNSWGASWGANGYILLGRGAKFNPSGQCGIQMAASYPVI